MDVLTPMPKLIPAVMVALVLMGAGCRPYTMPADEMVKVAAAARSCEQTGGTFTLWTGTGPNFTCEYVR